MIVRGCEFPEDRHYHPEMNVWVKEEGAGIVRLGATAYGVALAVEFFAFVPKAVGTRVETGKAVGLLELAKTMVSVRTPVPGEILGRNELAVATPSLIAEDPYREGWLVRLKTGTLDPSGLVSGAAIASAFETMMALENFEGGARS
jgi:glycine cleavage system H protein